MMMIIKKQKGQKICYKINIKFRDYKKCLKASQTNNIINYLEKKEIDGDSVKEIKKYKNFKRFKSERHNAFTEEINKSALSSNDDKTMQSIDSIETYLYGISKNLIRKKEKSKRISIIKK